MRSSIWNADCRLVLASKSQTRRQILEAAGLEFDIEACDLDERGLEQEFLQAGGVLEQLPLALARAKALRVSKIRPGAFCLGADQTWTHH